MRMKKAAAAALTAMAIGVGSAVVDPGVASANGGSAMMNALCRTACAINLPGTVTLKGVFEGKPVPVNVKGAPNTRISVRAFMLDDKKMVAISNAVPVSTDRQGLARVNVPLYRLKAPWNAGHIVTIQPADTTYQQLRKGPLVPKSVNDRETLTFRIRSARAMDKGFGVNETKVGATGVFHRRVDFGLTGDQYGVEIKVGGQWKDVTQKNHPTGEVSTMGTTVVQAIFPPNMPKGRYPTRLVNRTRKINDISPQPGYYIDWEGTAPYSKPGEYNHNGRRWRTNCEPYSKTQRCRTEIWSTQVVYDKGRYVTRSGWVFNNLTYTPSPRKLWRNNPLGKNAQWTSKEDGARWRTECDTRATGRGACRTYRYQKVVVRSGSWYSQAYQWVFNNVVYFS